MGKIGGEDGKIFYANIHNFSWYNYWLSGYFA